MAAGDSGVTALIDAANTVDVTPISGAGEGSGGVDDTPVEGVEENVGGEQQELENIVDETEDLNADGTAKTEEEREAFKAKQQDALDSTTGKTSAALRNQLKAWKSAADPNTPEGKAALAAIKELHQSYERWRSVTTDLGIKGGFGEIKAMRDMVVAHGGSVEAMRGTLQSISDVDEKLYRSSETGEAGINSAKSLVEDIVSDLKAENKLNGLGNLTSAFIGAAQKELGENGYAQYVALPAIATGLKESGAIGAYNDVYRYLKNGDTKAAMQRLGELGGWFKDILDRADSTKEKPLTEEQKQLADERTAFNNERTKYMQSEVGQKAEKEAQQILAQAISPLVRTAFFKGLSKVAQRDVAGKVVIAYRNAMASDKDLQAQYRMIWPKAASTNPKEAAAAKEKLLELSRNFVKDWSSKNNNARKVITDTYPQLLKGGSAAAGRLAGKAATAAASANGGPIYVASKPTNLVRNKDVSHGGKNYKAGDLTTLEILGKGFIPMSTGGFKFVTWRKA